MAGAVSGIGGIMFQPYQDTEDNFQISVTNYMRQVFPDVLHIHVANERKTKVMRSRSGRYFTPDGNKLKLKGVVSGVPDNLIFDWNLAIELKCGKNKLTENQKEFLKRLQDRGWNCFVIYSLDEFIFLATEFSQGRQVKSDRLFRPIL